MATEVTNDTPNPAPTQDQPDPKADNVTPPPADNGAELAAMRAELERERKERAKLKSQIDDAKAARMKEQNQWKELAEQREREANEARQESDNIKKSFLNEKRFSAVRAAAQALGLRPEAASDLDMLDMAEVQIETTSTGKINVLGADKFAEQLKRVKPHWFAEKQAPQVNTNGTRVHDTSGVITPKMLLDLEKEAKKTNDFSKYQEAHRKFQTQRLAARK